MKKNDKRKNHNTWSNRKTWKRNTQKTNKNKQIPNNTILKKHHKKIVDNPNLDSIQGDASKIQDIEKNNKHNEGVITYGIL